MSQPFPIRKAAKLSVQIDEALGPLPAKRLEALHFGGGEVCQN
jgi:hypothetical protein